MDALHSPELGFAIATDSGRKFFVDKLLWRGGRGGTSAMIHREWLFAIKRARQTFYARQNLMKHRWGPLSNVLVRNWRTFRLLLHQRVRSLCNMPALSSRFERLPVQKISSSGVTLRKHDVRAASSALLHRDFRCRLMEALTGLKIISYLRRAC